jgi:hypothetical protein
MTPLCSDIYLLQLKVPCKLLEEPCCRIETRYQRFGYCAPALGFVLLKARASQ